MKIVCLCENTPYREEFCYEHGLSLYIETNHKKILFDMGKTDVFYKNAWQLGVDLSTVDLAILSHGHYDHGGGLETFLTINKTAKIYMSEHAFGRYYNGTEKYIGLNPDLKGNERFVMCDDYIKLEDGLELYSKNRAPFVTPIDSAGLKVKKENVFLEDSFVHEQYLKITENGKSYLISGCSHKGILNIVNWFTPDVLVGGFHFMKQEADRRNPFFEKIAGQLKEFHTVYYTCHCTGVEQYAILKEHMKEKLDYLSAGKILEF